MNINNQVAVAIASFIGGLPVPGSPTIVSGIKTDLNAAQDSRIIVIGERSDLRKPSLPGLYDVTGSVNIIQSVDTDGCEAAFHATCDYINNALGGRYGMPGILQAIDPYLYVYSYQWIGSNLAASDRKFLAVYQWTAFVRNTANTFN